MTLAAPAFAVDTGAVLGGAIGGGVGAAVGSEVGGREGAIIGGAVGVELVQLLPQTITGMNKKRLLFTWKRPAKMGLLAMRMDIVFRQVMPSTNISASITKRYISKRRLSGHHFSRLNIPMNVYKGSFSAVQPITISYTLSLWPVPDYEGQLSANSRPPDAQHQWQLNAETGHRPLAGGAVSRPC